MKNKENHGEKQFYNEAFNISSSLSVDLAGVEVEWRCVLGHDLQKIDSQTFVNLHGFRHQQSDSVALPKLLFGHNYRGSGASFQILLGGGASAPTSELNSEWFMPWRYALKQNFYTSQWF